MPFIPTLEEDGDFWHHTVKDIFNIDKESFIKSRRCGQNICKFIRDNLGIQIESNINENYKVQYISEKEIIDYILNNPDIIKLHFKHSSKYGVGHKNWGETKGEDQYGDVCVLLNKETAKHYTNNSLKNLKPITRNKLYVAITRAHKNVYLIDEKFVPAL